MMSGSPSLIEYGLIDWPFRVVPDRDFARKWAGRPDTLRQLRRLSREMALNNVSSLHLMWADFGMGKTHSLYHLGSLVEANGQGRILAVYVVLPREAKSFFDIYQNVIASLPLARITALFARLVSDSTLQNVTNEHFKNQNDLGRALWLLATGDDTQQSIARRWLMGQKPNQTDLNRTGLGSTTRSPDQANSQLTALIQFLANADEEIDRVLIMFDEFQRIGSTSKRSFNEINDGLHTFFNQNPKGLSLILSFSFGDPSFVQFHLNDELKSRASKRTISLGPFSIEDATRFVGDLIELQRDEGHSGVPGTHPFTEEAVSEILQYITVGKPLTPRRIMLYFDHVMKEALLEEIHIIDGTFARTVLSDPEVGSLDTGA